MDRRAAPPLAGRLAALAAGLMAYVVLAPVVPQGSERFWLLLPLVALGLRLAQGSAGLRRDLLGGFALLALLIAVMAAYGASLTVMAFPRLPGAWRAVPPAEILRGGWYLLSLILVSLAAWRLARAAILDRHLARGGAPDALVPQVLPVLLASPFIATVMLSSTFIHRFHIPVLTLPQRPGTEEIVLQTEDGARVAAWFVPSPGASRTAVIGHGLSANRSMFLPFLQVADALDANALLIDLRGHGQSSGHTLSFGAREWQEVVAAVRWLREVRPAQARQVLGVGVSLSTAAVVLAGARLEPPLDGLVLDSAFAAPTELTDQALAHIPGPLRRLLVLPGVPLASLEAGCWLPSVRPIEALPAARAPIWFAHADGDTFIPSSQGKRMFAAASEPKELYLSPTRTHAHSLLDAPEPYLASLARFFAAHLP